MATRTSVLVSFRNILISFCRNWSTSTKSISRIEISRLKAIKPFFGHFYTLMPLGHKCHAFFSAAVPYS